MERGLCSYAVVGNGSEEGLALVMASVAVTKYHDQKQFMERKVCLGLQSQRLSMEKGFDNSQGKHNDKNRKLTACVLIHTGETKRPGSWERLQTLNVCRIVPR